VSLIPVLLTGRSKLLLALSAVAIVVPPSAAANLKLPYFLLCGLALIPLAQITAELVDCLVQRVGERLGGLLNVTLGNMLELVIALTALRSGLYDLVVVSIAGAVITNSLLVLGISTILAGRRNRLVDLNHHSRGLSTRQLLISVILMSVPSIFFWNSMHPIAEGGEVMDFFAAYSLIVAVVVMVSYLLSYILSSFFLSLSCSFSISLSSLALLFSSMALCFSSIFAYSFSSLFLFFPCSASSNRR
jgi:Ca2+:H+ antiporter